MSCPRTQHLLKEYFVDQLPRLSREEIDRHLSECNECASELAILLDTQSRLLQWHDERIPHWDRGAALFRTELETRQKSTGVGIWQWLPAAMSCAMFVILVFNLSVSVSNEGFSVSFGADDVLSGDSPLEQRLAELITAQQLEREQTLRNFMTQVTDTQESNNLSLIQAVLNQTREITAENFDQMYSYFEQQRQRDLENVRVSYQQLVDSDYDTLRSVQQLANFVRFQDEQP